MSLFQRILGLESKASKAFRMHFSSLPAPSWTPRNYAAFVKEGYKQNVIAFSAINRICDAVATIEWQVWENGKIIRENHPYLELMANPNPWMTGAELWKTRIGYLLLSGNAYDEMVEESGKVLEIWPLRPDRMKIVPNPKTGTPREFIYSVNQQKMHFPVDPFTGESSIRHTKLFNPSDDLYGMSPIEAGSYSVDQHNASMNWIQSLLGNAARPSGALIVKEETGLTEEEFHRLKGQIEEQYSGSENAGRPMLLEGGMDWKAMGLSPMDMEILRTKESSARDIALAFGVPPLLLNIPGDNTYANYREARLGFYEDTILPLVRYETANLNAWLSPFFNGAQLHPNIEAIEAIADKRERMWNMANDSDDITLNESRAMKGLDPLPDPLGSTLMAEVRARKTPDTANPNDLQSVEKSLKELAYGNAR